MELIDYTINYKSKYKDVGDFIAGNHYDLFISAFNDSERVKTVFNQTNASESHWLILPEYNYKKSEYPTIVDKQRLYEFERNMEEGEIIRSYFEKARISKESRLCFDTTGFVRPHLIFLVRFLKKFGIDRVDFIYTDPISYIKKENTSFTIDYVEVKSVNGCEGIHNPDTANDLLIVGSGYDDKRIADVSKSKANARKVQLFGFPSLQPDMYQENVIKAYKAEEASTGGERYFIDSSTSIFAPANDPFVTAQNLSDFINFENQKKPVTNLYLSPLSTKAQTLGFALYYITECLEKPVSIIFPYCSGYARETTEGISKIWKYTVEFD